MGKHNEFAFRTVEFYMLLDYPGSYVHQEAVKIRVELKEILELKGIGWVDKTMDIGKFIKVKERQKITNNRVLENL